MATFTCVQWRSPLRRTSMYDFVPPVSLGCCSWQQDVKTFCYWSWSLDTCRYFKAHKIKRHDSKGWTQDTNIMRGDTCYIYDISPANQSTGRSLEAFTWKCFSPLKREKGCALGHLSYDTLAFTTQEDQKECLQLGVRLLEDWEKNWKPLALASFRTSSFMTEVNRENHNGVMKRNINYKATELLIKAGLCLCFYNYPLMKG